MEPERISEIKDISERLGCKRWLVCWRAWSIAIAHAMAFTVQQTHIKSISFEENILKCA